MERKHSHDERCRLEEERDGEKERDGEETAMMREVG